MQLQCRLGDCWEDDTSRTLILYWLMSLLHQWNLFGNFAFVNLCFSIASNSGIVVVTGV